MYTRYPVLCGNGWGNPIIYEQPDAIKTYLVQWKGAKTDLTKLAKLRWIKNLTIPELCSEFNQGRTAIYRCLRTLRNSGLSQLNLTREEQKTVQNQMKQEMMKEGWKYR